VTIALFYAPNVMCFGTIAPMLPVAIVVNCGRLSTAFSVGYAKIGGFYGFFGDFGLRHKVAPWNYHYAILIENLAFVY